MSEQEDLDAAEYEKLLSEVGTLKSILQPLSGKKGSRFKQLIPSPPTQYTPSYEEASDVEDEDDGGSMQGSLLGSEGADEDDLADEEDLETGLDGFDISDGMALEGSSVLATEADDDDLLGLDSLAKYVEDEQDEDDDNDATDVAAGTPETDLPGGSRGLPCDIELRPGEVVVPGSRLATLFEALEKNQALQSFLKGVMGKVERIITRNWNDTVAVQQVPEKSRKSGRASKTAAADPLSRPQLGSCRPEPGVPYSGGSRYWRVHGVAPQPNPDTALLAGVMEALPTSYERTRWTKHRAEALRQGVESEVRHMLTDRALKAFQNQAMQGAGAQGAGMMDLGAEFARIKAITIDTAEAQKVVAQFGPEQWERVSHTFVKDRSASDCRIFYLHAAAPQRPWPLEESEKLRALATKYHGHQWERIAAELGTCRTAAQCLQHYLKYIKPQHVCTRSIWSEADDELLRSLVERYGTQWVKISSEMGKRYDRHQVRDRWHGQTQRKHDRKVGRWGYDEDERLLQAVSVNGLKWPAVAAAVQTRTAQQCRERYINVLDPNLNLKAFTKEEERLLRSTFDEHERVYGRVIWTEVAKLFPGRTDEMIRRSWKSINSCGEVRFGGISAGKGRKGRPPKAKRAVLHPDAPTDATPASPGPSEVQLLEGPPAAARQTRAIKAPRASSVESPETVGRPRRTQKVPTVSPSDSAQQACQPVETDMLPAEALPATRATARQRKASKSVQHIHQQAEQVLNTQRATSFPGMIPAQHVGPYEPSRGRAGSAVAVEQSTCHPGVQGSGRVTRPRTRRRPRQQQRHSKCHSHRLHLPRTWRWH